MEDLFIKWIMAKEVEKKAIDDRRLIEDKLSKLLNISPDLDGTQTKEIGDMTVKIVGRINRTIDADKVGELAGEHGLQYHLQYLFRWKPEINMQKWRATDQSITRLLAPAITEKPSRPSFTITRKGE